MIRTTRPNKHMSLADHADVPDRGPIFSMLCGGMGTGVRDDVETGGSEG